MKYREREKRRDGQTEKQKQGHRERETERVSVKGEWQFLWNTDRICSHKLRQISQILHGLTGQKKDLDFSLRPVGRMLSRGTKRSDLPTLSMH